MNRIPECVIDTTVLQKANAPLAHQPNPQALIRSRLDLLHRIRSGQLRPLISSRLLAEYRRQVPKPRNDTVKAFLELLDDPERSRLNWHTPWSGKYREWVAKCRYPQEDVHVLRTAYTPENPTTVFGEEERMLKTDACIYRHFRVHLLDPSAVFGATPRQGLRTRLDA